MIVNLSPWRRSETTYDAGVSAARAAWTITSTTWRP